MLVLPHIHTAAAKGYSLGLQTKSLLKRGMAGEFDLSACT
jgi:hypothetical protein